MTHSIGGKLTRSAFLRLSALTAGLTAGLQAAGTAPVAASSAVTAGTAWPLPAQAAEAVEQNLLKRGKLGLRAIDRDKAWPGYTLIAPLVGQSVLLLDLEGNVVHEWQTPHPPGQYGYLTERGTLFFNGRVFRPSFIGRSDYTAGSALEMDWDGNVLWEVQHPDHHHDGIKLRNGNVMLICAARVPDEIAAQIQGGRPGTEYRGEEIYADYLAEVTTQGDTVWEWRAWEHLDPAVDVITEVQANRDEWTHGNAVYELPSGNIVLSFRNISTVVVIDRRTGEIVWKLGAPPLAGQHAPEPLPNGNFLIFNNGPHRLDATLPYSSVIEVDARTQRIVWEYKDTPSWNFFSARISGAQRLPNGNTLICEGLFGRLFEVTPEGEVVWEYVSPYFGAPPGAKPGEEYNSLFRAYRYSEAQVARARRTGT